MARLGTQGWQNVRATFAGLIQRHLDRQRGRAVTSEADRLLAVFDGPSRAIRCAQAIVDEGHTLGIRLRADLSVAAVLAATSASAAESADTPSNLRVATAAFSDPTAAIASGYDPLVDVAGIACIDMPDQGGMGVHYVEGSLVDGGKLDPARPQALVYEVTSDGRARLAALEYVVLQCSAGSLLTNRAILPTIILVQTLVCMALLWARARRSQPRYR